MSKDMTPDVPACQSVLCGKPVIHLSHPAVTLFCDRACSSQFSTAPLQRLNSRTSTSHNIQGLALTAPSFVLNGKLWRNSKSPVCVVDHSWTVVKATHT